MSSNVRQSCPAKTFLCLISTQNDVLLNYLGSSYQSMSTNYENHSMNPYSQYLSTFNSTHPSISTGTNEQTSETMRNDVSNTTFLHEEIERNNDDDEYCQICGDTASGWHCG